MCNSIKISAISFETEVPGAVWLSPAKHSWRVFGALIIYVIPVAYRTYIHISSHHCSRWFQSVNSCLPIVTPSIHELTASNCDVKMTYCSRVSSIDDLLSLWHRGRGFKEFLNYTSGPSTPSFITESVLFGKWRHNQLTKGNTHGMNNGFNHIATMGQHGHYVQF